MSSRGKYIAGGIAIGLLVGFMLNWWFAALIILGAIAIPVAGYLMLDPSQRRRLREQSRRRLG